MLRHRAFLRVLWRSRGSAVIVTRLFESTTTVGNAADTNEADLHTFTLPANTLTKNGDAILIRTWIQCLASGNAKQAQVYFGSTVIGNSTQQTFNNVGFFVDAMVFRTGAATQLAVCDAVQPNMNAAWSVAAGGGLNTSTPGETLSGTVSIRITGRSPIAGEADAVSALATTIDYLPAA